MTSFGVKWPWIDGWKGHFEESGRNTSFSPNFVSLQGILGRVGRWTQHPKWHLNCGWNLKDMMLIYRESISGTLMARTFKWGNVIKKLGNLLISHLLLTYQLKLRTYYEQTTIDWHNRTVHNRTIPLNGTGKSVGYWQLILALVSELKEWEPLDSCPSSCWITINPSYILYSEI